MMPGADIMLLLLGLGTAVAVLTLGLALSTGGSKVAKRAERLHARSRGELKVPQSLVRNSVSELDVALARFIPDPAKLRARLERTGRKIGLATYLGISAAIMLGVLVALLQLRLSVWVAILASALAGIWLPHLVVGFLARRRVKRFESLFPEAIGLAVRGLKAGLPVTEAVGIVGREVADPVGEEFRRVADQVRLGQSLDAAMWEAARRTGLAEFNFLVITLSVQKETGGNLAETLENLDNILRRRRQMKLKVKAMSSEARASAMIIGALPFAMLAILAVVNPRYVMTLFTTDTGHLLLASGAASMGFGVLVMARLVRFEI